MQSMQCKATCNHTVTVGSFIVINEWHCYYHLRVVMGFEWLLLLLSIHHGRLHPHCCCPLPMHFLFSFFFSFSLCYHIHTHIPYTTRRYTYIRLDIVTIASIGRRPTESEVCNTDSAWDDVCLMFCGVSTAVIYSI
jgi:hypothetical protein